MYVIVDFRRFGFQVKTTALSSDGKTFSEILDVLRKAVEPNKLKYTPGKDGNDNRFLCQACHQLVLVSFWGV